MTHFYLDKEAYEYLCEWAEEYKTAVKYSPAFYQKVQVHLHGTDLKFYIESKRYGLRFSLLDEDGQIIKGKLLHYPDSESDYDLEFSTAERADNETHIHIMQVFCTAYVQANCFMWYGNVCESKEYVASGKTVNEDKVITFRKYKGEVYAVNAGHHRSPEGVFSVRGHFRKYQSGKVIWIDEYLKGIK